MHHLRSIFYAILTLGVNVHVECKDGVHFKCGRRLVKHEALIVNGYETKEGDWPWHANILHISTNLNIQYKCGGTLLDSESILTAAHCVYENGRPLVTDRILIHLGRQNLILTRSYSQEIQVYQIFPHPKFNASSLANDIAIIRLATKAHFNDYVQPVCLWDPNKKDISSVVGKYGTVVGFGITEMNQVSHVLRQATIPVVNLTTCLESDRNFFGNYLSESTFCAGYTNGTTACNGDSGGALTFEENGVYRIRGIVSLTQARPGDVNGFCKTDQYVVFTDVVKYFHWIQERVPGLSSSSIGDPYASSTEKRVVYPIEILHPCNPSPCGANAICEEQNGAGSCACIQNYYGDPYIACRPECIQNSDCPHDKACLNTKCVNPCLNSGTCGQDAVCKVANHIPICSCIGGYTGNALVNCHRIIEPEYPCLPSPCGPFSICREIDNLGAICSCQPNYLGEPPNCRPECTTSSECSRDKSCVNTRCVDPCPGVCGHNARCRVGNHNPICYCNRGFVGDPFVQCIPEPTPIIPDNPNPCVSTPCGPNSVCRVHESQPVCTCVANYIGRPPNCRPECTVNSECPSNKACLNEKCRDPCIGACALNAECQVHAHKPRCTCSVGYEGDPFSGCRKIVPTVEVKHSTERGILESNYFTEDTVNWAGFQWIVRDESNSGPGPNNWKSSNVWIDPDNRLHLKLAYSPEFGWTCAEIYSKESFGFGTYRWFVEGAIDKFDPNVVLALFTYGSRVDGTDEVSIQMSKWGRLEPEASNLFYIVYPRTFNGTKPSLWGQRTALQGTYTTHQFKWTADYVRFQSQHGFQNLSTQEVFFKYQTPTTFSRHMPRLGVPLHMNLYALNGTPPINGREVEIVIHDFRYEKEQAEST